MSTQTTAAEFNAAHPVGTPVRYWPGTRSRTSRSFVSKTRSPAWTLYSGTPVVMVDGYAGGIALTHIQVVA